MIIALIIAQAAEIAVWLGIYRAHVYRRRKELLLYPPLLPKASRLDGWAKRKLVPVASKRQEQVSRVLTKKLRQIADTRLFEIFVLGQVVRAWPKPRALPEQVRLVL